MNTDIRIKTSFPNHPKTLKLIDLMGETAPWKLIKLWLFAGQSKPDGILSNMSKTSICSVMGHKGNPTQMINSLKKCGFLDKHESGFWQLHDWKEHNPYAFNAPSRVARAKKGAAALWEKKRKQHDTTCSKQDEALLQADNSNAPAPAPAPSPTPLVSGDKSTSNSPRRLGEVAFEKAETAWKQIEDGLLKDQGGDRIVIDDQYARKIIFDLGGRDRILELHGQNGDQLHKEFVSRYSVLEVAGFKAKVAG